VRPRDDGATLLEAAFALPIFLLLFIGGLFLGLATVDQIRLERIAGYAVELTEPDARALLDTADATLDCYWQGEGAGGCFDDGLTFPRTQLAAHGRTWQLPAGSVTPRVQTSKPTEGET
jgi:hypothetical protein